MEQSKDLDAYVINTIAYFFFLLLIMLTGSSLSALLAIIMHNKFFIFIGMFTLIVFPLITFEKQFRKHFIRKVIIKCSSDAISVAIYNRKTQELEKTDLIELNQIKSFKLLTSVKDESCIFKVNLKNCTKVTYRFLNTVKEIKHDMVEDILYNSLKEYNNSQTEESRIHLSPNLFASNIGTFFITVLTLSFIGVLIFEAIYKPKAIIFTMLGSGFLYLIIIAQRRQDLKDLDNFNIK